MSLGHLIAHNTVLQSVTKVLTTLLGIVAFGMMTRYLGTSGFGAYTTITSFLQFFGILADCGLSLVALQMISEAGKDPEKHFSTIFSIRCVTILIFTLLAPLISLFFPYPIELKIGIALMSLSFVLSSLIQMARVVFQYKLRMDIPLYADTASYLVLLAGIGLVVFFQGGLYGILAVIIINNLVQFSILAFCAELFLPLRFGFDKAIAIETFKRGWPIALSIICNLIYLRTDTLLLSLMKTQTDVGLYGAAYRIIDVLGSFPSMFMGLTLASFSQSWSNRDAASFSRYFQKSFDFMIITSLPLIVGTLFVARPLLVLLSGEEFAVSGDLLQILILGAAALFFGNLFGYLINVIHAQRTMLFGYLATAIVGFIGYLILIPRFSYWGAAWVTVATEGAVAICAFIIFWKKTGIFPRTSCFSKTLLASAFMAAVLWSLQSLSLLISVPLAALVYIACLVKLKVIPASYFSHFFKNVTK